MDDIICSALSSRSSIPRALLSVRSCPCGAKQYEFIKMKAMVCALALAAVLAVANCAPYQIAYLVPVDAPVVRVARSPQFSGSAANAGAQSFNSGGGFPGFGGFSGSAANAASQSFSAGGGFPGHGGFSGSAASAGAQSFSGGSGFPGFGGFSGSAANAGAQSFSG
ncbi:glycine, alanine and asparagine-rich protein-like [Anopheles stephensi]|nr:glycine, alanine and asparagine-rich protein-like [Anopheles stephensi]